MRPVCVTVDVEDFFLPRPPVDAIFARSNRGEYGIGRIMSALEAHGAKGTFYVDVMNRKTLREAVIREACEAILSRGHELGLHTHPSFPGRVRGVGMKEVMFRLGPKSQETFIRQATDLITAWTGQAPHSHRAGGYGANVATLEALGRCGYTSDSSHYYGYAGCPLATTFPTANTCFDLGGVREIPVSITLNRFGVPLPKDGWLGPVVPMKIDINWLDGPSLITQIDACLAESSAPVVIFLHSYSLLALHRQFQPDTEAIARLDAILAYVTALPGVSFMTVSDAARAVVPSLIPLERRPPRCDFTVTTDLIRWVRFGSVEFSWKRLGKIASFRGGCT